jgi:predicted nucleotidyltransferase
VDRDKAITILQLHEAELRKLGVTRLSLFGSTARGEASRRSDVDVSIELAPGPRGFAHLDLIDAIRDRLADILGVPVDIVEEPADRPRLQQEIERDRVVAF